MVKCESEHLRLQRAVTAHRRWVAELEVRWVAAGQSPGTFAELLRDDRTADVASWLDRYELGW